jgi:hypothetical protein
MELSNELLIMMGFIFILIIIITTHSLSAAALITSLVVNMLAFNKQITRGKKRKQEMVQVEHPDVIEHLMDPVSSPLLDEPDCGAASVAEGAYSIDDKINASQMQRDKLRNGVIEGATSRDYNRYNAMFADELDEGETKQWWGNYDK